MRLSELHYDLPPELIAQHPVEPRDASRLLVLDRASGRIEHCVFREIGQYFAAGDVLVLNDTRVIPARFYCRRATGAAGDGLFLHAADEGWHVLLRPSRRLRVGEALISEGSPVRLRIVERGDRGEWLVQPDPPVEPLAWLAEVGHTPLPPYIRRGADIPSGSKAADAERYQTVYADRPGAVAAPTAGLHFTAELLANLAERGVQTARVTLHVGPGTFVPIVTDDLADHPMHAEWFEILPAELAKLQAVRVAGGRIVAVGTTSVRVLESLPVGTLDGRRNDVDCRTADTAVAPTRREPARLTADTAVAPSIPADPGLASGVRTEHPKEGLGEGVLSGWTRIFLYPPYPFRHVDRLITNFHLPGSTLLALVMAFASPEQIRTAYRTAIEQRYRFYSYGDAMLIL